MPIGAQSSQSSQALLRDAASEQRQCAERVETDAEYNPSGFGFRGGAGVKYTRGKAQKFLHFPRRTNRHTTVEEKPDRILSVLGLVQSVLMVKLTK